MVSGTTGGARLSRFFCAVPARAGSKRLPGKNLADLCGRPLIAHTIEAALLTGLFEAVYVCTEDATIARAAEQAGARVPLLVPPTLAGDSVASHIPCQWVAAEILGDAALDIALVCLQPTSPLRTAADISAAVHRFDGGNADFLVSVTALDPHYFHWAVEVEGSYARMFFGDRFLKDRLELPQVYRPNGAIKVAHMAALKAYGNFFGPGLTTMSMPEERSVHVASRMDLDFCEFLIQRRAP